MSYGIIKNPQFVMVTFSLLESAAFTALRGDALKLYLYMRRFVWRRETGALGEYYASGHLAINGFLGTWAEVFGVSKSTISRLLDELADAGWVAWVHKSARAGEPNVLELGIWTAVGGQRIEVFYADTLGEDAPEAPDEAVADEPGEATVSPPQHTVSNMQHTVAPVQRTVSNLQPSNRERNREQNTQSAPEANDDDGIAEFEALFGPDRPQTRYEWPSDMSPQDYLRQRLSAIRVEPPTTWGSQSSEFERYLNRPDVDPDGMRALGERLDELGGHHPVWRDRTDVRRWCDGLKKLLAVAEGNLSTVEAAYAKMRAEDLTISTPFSLVEVTRALRAERSTAPEPAEAITLNAEQLAALAAVQ